MPDTGMVIVRRARPDRGALRADARCAIGDSAPRSSSPRWNSARPGGTGRFTQRDTETSSTAE